MRTPKAHRRRGGIRKHVMARQKGKKSGAVRRLRLEETAALRGELSFTAWTTIRRAYPRRLFLREEKRGGNYQSAVRTGENFLCRTQRRNQFRLAGGRGVFL